MKEKLFYRNEAVTPIISTILLLVITLIIIGGIVAWALPTILDQQSDARYESSYNNLEVVATSMEESVYTGKDSSRTVNFDLAGGDMNIKSRVERWIISYTYINASLNLTNFLPKSKIFSYDFSNRETEHNVVKIRNLENENMSIYETDNDTVVMEEPLLANPVHISIFNGTKTNLHSKLAEVWLFYVDAISYRQATGKGQYNILVLNCGIITDPNSKYGYVARKPMVFAEENSMLIYIVQLNSTALTGGGAGKYRLTTTVEDLVVRKVGEVRHLRIRIEGDKYRQAWYTSFFISEIGCKEGYRDEDGVLRSVEFSPTGYQSVSLKLVQVYQSLRLEAR